MRNVINLLFRRFAMGSCVSLFLLAVPGMIHGQTSSDGVIADGIIDLEEKVIQETAYENSRPMAEVFDLRVERQVDMLFVIDNSKSMREEQALLAKSFAAYIDQFIKRDLDFHIGVIVMEAGPGKLVAPRKLPQPFLTRDTPDLAKEFARLTTRGTGGTRAETAFLPLIEAVKNPANASFFRQDALLSVVIISDEDESFGGRNENYLREKPEELQQRLFDLKTALLNAKMGKRGLVRLDVVTAPDPIPKGCVTKISGVALTRAAKELGGSAISLCEDFSGPLVATGDVISQVAQRRFSLRQLPFVVSIQVLINDTPVAKDEKNGWSLDFDANAINLHGEALAKSFGSVITVNYRWAPDPLENPDKGEAKQK
ncbi:MAG: VWA domain-containing protein [Verrucomicrobiota bacterium]|nr:VWA domain-containing protein [Verrucomicrobiota bacterium]